MSNYEIATGFVAYFGLAYFGLIFVAALAHALLPSKRGAFDHAAHIPLRED